MTDKELKRLNREELLEILVEQASEIERLKAELEQMKGRLDSRELKCSKAGSIAEAALSVNEVFERAQAAADQYIENIRDRPGVSKC